MERETRVTSNTFLLVFAFYFAHSALSTPKIGEAILFLVYSFIKTNAIVSNATWAPR